MADNFSLDIFFHEIFLFEKTYLNFIAESTDILKRRSHFELTKKHPYLALTYELWVYRELRGEKWPRYIGSALCRADLIIGWAILKTLVTKDSADCINKWILPDK